MLGKHLVAALTATAILGIPVPEARAGNLAAGIAGAIIGGAIVSAAQNKKRQKTYRKVRKSSANRQENREIQTSLNYFSFPAGTPDGALGRRSRQAISSYQAFMGFPVTGHLTQYEKEFLLDSYHQAQAGGTTTSQLIASNGQGVRGLLIAYRDQRANGGERNFAGMGSFGGLPPVVAAAVREIAKSSDPTAEQLIQRAGFVQLADINQDGQTDYILDTSVTGSAFWCNQQSCAVRVFASTPDGYQRNDFQAFNVQPAMFKCQRGNCEKVDTGPVMALAPAQTPQQTLPNTYQASAQQPGAPVPSAQPVVRGAAAPASGGFSIPSFGGGETTVSMNNHCNKVSLITNTNGGFTNVSTMQDPVFALNEQFCLARIYAISQSEEMIKKVQGISPAQMQAQCETLGPAFKEQVSALSLGQRDQVIAKTSEMILSTGMSPAQLTHTAKICLGVGYRTDNADVALASTLILVTLGEPVYGELLGHHLLNGFGTSKRKDLAVQWYASANNAIEMGMPAVFVPGQTDRPALIQAAVARLSSPAPVAAAPAAPKNTGFVVPTFGASSN